LPEADNTGISPARDPVVASITPEAVRQQVAKIAASGIFAESSRMNRFLRFAIDETLRGAAGRLKEVLIGIEVFDRTPDYDPRLDPIVRVEARRLRKKLLAYYAGPGKHDKILIEFPKGQYSPVFQTRSAVPNERAPEVGSQTGTIAVLPFSNFSPQPESGYFSDGMVEELIHALTRIPGLRVVAWNTVAQLRDQQEDLTSIRSRLAVDYVLRGSVRNSGERLRISAQLIETATGHYLWSHIWDRKLHDVFAIQEEIAALIAAALKLHLWKAAARRPELSGSLNMECYQLCLKGRFHLRERTSDGLRRSVICFERAIEIDAESAIAHAGLADTWTLIAEYGVATPGESMPKAKAAALKALELDPNSAEAHAALGLVLSQYDWHWKEAEREFRRALELNYGYATAHHWYAADYLALMGRLDEATVEIGVAHEMDPLSSIIREGQGFLKLLARRYDEAIDDYGRLARSDPSFYKAWTSLGRAYLQKRMFMPAITNLEAGRSLAPEVPSILGALGEAHARSGNVTAACKCLEELQKMISHRPVPATCFALIHLGLGEKQEAITWLEQSAERREPQVLSLKVHPAYDDLRDESRFQALLNAIGFPP
jgi:TolB-like protein/Flp pilus assembly protein TadD